MPGMFGSQAPPTAATLSPDEQWLQNMSATYAQNMKYAKPGPYQTTLNPDQEAAFRTWVGQNRVPFNPTDRAPQDYDMRGFYQGLASGDPRAATAVNQNDGMMHFPDTWKTPWHHSASAESIYMNSNAPRWINDSQLSDPNTGNVVWDERYMGRPAPVSMAPLAPARPR